MPIITIPRTDQPLPVKDFKRLTQAMLALAGAGSPTALALSAKLTALFNLTPPPYWADRPGVYLRHPGKPGGYETGCEALSLAAVVLLLAVPPDWFKTSHQ